jgi:Spy/CpxP family protein refolding chaperone
MDHATKEGTMRFTMIRTGTSALAIALAAASSVLAQPTQPDPVAPRLAACQRSERHLLTAEDREAVAGVVWARLKERLGLSDQQAGDVQATVRAQRDARRADLRQLCEARHELRALMAQAAVDPAALRAVADRVKAAESQLIDHRLDGYLALRQQLTPEQWEKWRALRREMRPRRHGGAGMGRLAM